MIEYISPANALKMNDKDIKNIIMSQMDCKDPDIIEIIKTDINEVKAGDTVFHHGAIQTVCKNNIKKPLIMESTLFGDSYRLGMDKTIKINFKKAQFNGK